MSAERVARGDGCWNAIFAVSVFFWILILIMDTATLRSRIDRLEARLGIEQLPPSAGEAPEEVGTQEDR